MGAVIIPIKSYSKHLKNPGPATAKKERTLLLTQGLRFTNAWQYFSENIL
jgi:hypothetical protein